MGFKLENLDYRNVKKLKHNGKIGHNNGENIAVHVVNMLDDRSHYKTINGKLHIRALDVKGGRIVRDEKYIPIERHNGKHLPKIKNPLV